MKILFVAKHQSGDNDDEGAVTHALRELGHDVVCIHEKRRHRDSAQVEALRNPYRFDFCLFFKWENVDEIVSLGRKLPCFPWYFDLVANDDDPTLTSRMADRRRWFDAVLPYCRGGFVTDGDWAARWNSEADAKSNVVTLPRLWWLTQGADERTVGEGNATAAGPEILFTGMVNHGRTRAEHVQRLRDKYGDRFAVVGDRGPGHRVHGRKLANLLASAKVVVAPDGPVTARYWSNRVYLTLGLGGFLLHPKCEGLNRHYTPVTELQYYSDRDHLEAMIDYYVERPESHLLMRYAGMKATEDRNLYRHRVTDLLEVVRNLI